MLLVVAAILYEYAMRTGDPELQAFAAVTVATIWVLNLVVIGKDLIREYTALEARGGG